MGLTLFDTGVLIGFLDRTDAHHAKARNEFEAAQARGGGLGIPALALAEALVNPSRHSAEAVRRVRAFIDALPLEVVPLDAETALIAAELRAHHGTKLRLPDSLVVATARACHASVLVTSERGWPTRKALKLQGQLIVL